MSPTSSNSLWQTESLENENYHDNGSVSNAAAERNDENQNMYPRGSSVEEEEEGIEKVHMDVDIPFDPASFGFKEIGNLASWTVSSCKPGCGIEALRDEETSLFWQSDGPQPHFLDIHFSRLVSIVLIRLFLDFDADESYTPTRIMLLAGTGYHDLIPFSNLTFEQPRGWINISLDQVGGGEDGKTLKAFLLQVKIVENHQNGKDTHIRGLKIYSKLERDRDAHCDIRESANTTENIIPKTANDKNWLAEPDWMGDFQLR
ncbi:Anaphase-promoting complex subunit 10 [Erysiphe necator]|nr:Anaphase-promoting complex subunit 10 [Erysiphe necator]